MTSSRTSIQIGQAEWKRSSRCNFMNNCVEVAQLGEQTIGIRDSKNPKGPHLEITLDAFRQLIDHTKTRGQDLH